MADGRREPHGVTLAPWMVDMGIVAVVMVPIVVGTIHIDADGPTDRPIDALALIVAIAAGAALLGRRRWPWVVFAVAMSAAAVYTARAYPGGPIYLAATVALYDAAAASSRRVGYVTAALVAVGLFLISLIARRDVALDDLAFVGWTAIAALAADAVRGRRERAAAEAERRRHEDEQRAEESRRHRAEERLRLARDLHDSVAHSMATINVQSGVAAHVLARDPGQAGAALEAIRVASRDVLDELGTMLDVLRDVDAAPRHPTPDLERIDGLVESSRLAGLHVSVHRDAGLDDVPAPVVAAAYRIVQEALTNVVRHAGATTATVTLRRLPDGGLDVDVVDDGSAPPATATANGSGMGLVGIRERASITAGRAEIGPCAGGGFRVHVTWTARP